MPDIAIADSFDIEKTYEYILSIRINLNGFSFSVISTTENKLHFFKNSPRKISSITSLKRHLEEWFENEELLKKPYKKINSIIYSEYFSLIPEQLYSEPLKNLLPRIIFENKEFEIAENAIPRYQSKLIFTLPQGINQTIQNLWGECDIIHPVKLIVNNLPEITDENGLVLFFDVKNFYILLFNHQTVLSANSYKLAHINDVIYFTLTLLKQSGISPKHTTFFISDFETHSLHAEENLKEYFSEIIQLDRIIDFSGTQQNIPFIHLCHQ